MKNFNYPLILIFIFNQCLSIKQKTDEVSKKTVEKYSLDYEIYTLRDFSTYKYNYRVDDKYLYGYLFPSFQEKNELTMRNLQSIDTSDGYWGLAVFFTIISFGLYIPFAIVDWGISSITYPKVTESKKIEFGKTYDVKDIPLEEWSKLVTSPKFELEIDSLTPKNISLENGEFKIPINSVYKMMNEGNDEITLRIKLNGKYIGDTKVYLLSENFEKSNKRILNEIAKLKIKKTKWEKEGTAFRSKEIEEKTKFCENLMLSFSDFSDSSTYNSGCKNSCRKMCTKLWTAYSNDWNKCDTDCNKCWTLLKYEQDDCRR